MPATPARIGFIQNEFRRAIASDPAVKTLFGSAARESDDPTETWFDDPADAQIIADERLALLSGTPRRFRLTVNETETLLASGCLESALLARAVDPDRAVDRNMIVSEVTLNLESNSATVMTWG